MNRVCLIIRGFINYVYAELILLDGKDYQVIAQSTLYYTALRAERAMQLYACTHNLRITNTITLERQEELV